MPFLKALEESGFAAQRNIAIEYRFAEGQDERLPMLAAEFVARQVTMLVATDRPSALAARAATQDNSHRIHQRVRPRPAWPGRQL